MDVFGADVPFAGQCGIEPVAFENGCTRLRLAASPQNANNLGRIHGGAICTLLDIAMASVARCTAGAPMVTLDMQVAFLAAAEGELVAEGRVLRGGGRLWYCEAEARAADGTLIAKASSIVCRA